MRGTLGNQPISNGLRWVLHGEYEDPYWRQIGTTHLAIPLADREIQKALSRILSISEPPEDDDIIDYTYPNGSKITTTRASCKGELLGIALPITAMDVDEERSMRLSATKNIDPIPTSPAILQIEQGV